MDWKDITEVVPQPWVKLLAINATNFNYDCRVCSFGEKFDTGEKSWESAVRKYFERNCFTHWVYIGEIASDLIKKVTYE